jgi:hypothetical protein
MGRITPTFGSLIRTCEPNGISVAQIATACAETEGITQRTNESNLLKGIHWHENHYFCRLTYLPPVAFYRRLLADVFAEQNMRQRINHHTESTHACDHAKS